jgi:hypothetical protein
MCINCNQGLPGGPYTDSKPGKINRQNHQLFKEYLESQGMDFRYNMYFWDFLAQGEKTYLTVFESEGGKRIYFHLLVKNWDDRLSEIYNAGGYRHALLKGLEWDYDSVDGVQEMIYTGITKIVD